MKLLSFQFIFGSLLYLLTSNILMGEQRTSIVLGTEDWPPFSYEDKVSGKISGLSTDVINATFRRMGISIKANGIYPWARAQEEVYSGRLDAIYTASTSDERIKYCYFPSEPIVTSKWVLFIKKSDKGSLHFEELSDLKNKSIGFILGYNYPSKFRKYVTENSWIETASVETENISKLIGGRYDYMPAVLETTLYLAKNRSQLKTMDAINNIYYFPTPLATTNFYLMFSKKTVTKAFVEKFTKALIEFKKTDEYQMIIKNYQ